MKKLFFALSCALLLGTLGIRSASADVFGFSFTGLDTGSGTFTANPNGTPGQFLISGMGGTVNGSTITALLAPGTFPFPGSSSANDNILYFPATIPAVDPNQTVASFLDTSGVSFLLGSQKFNLYFGSIAAHPSPADTGYNLFYPNQVSNDLLSTFTVTPSTVATTPEPGSLILLGTGVTGLAGVVRRRFTRA